MSILSTLVPVAAIVLTTACLRPRPAADTAGEAATGAALFARHCALCHGDTGHGDGRRSASLTVAPSDLTSLARRNGGVFPEARVTRTIDGRNTVEGHGGAGMPVWGDAFLEPGDGYDRATAKAKIAQLTRYLATIQSPAP